MRHSYRHRVRFKDCDPAGIAFFPRFFEWFHDAFESLFEAALGLDYATVLSRFGTGYPAVLAVSDWRRPARLGEDVEIEVFLSRLAERSATFEYRARREGVLLATASIKIAGMSLATHRSAPLPVPIRAAFSAYVEEDGERPDTTRIR